MSKAVGECGGCCCEACPTPSPQPVLTGAKARCAEVLPGVAPELGTCKQGFGHGLVIRTPQAATNPALDQLRLVVGGAGLGVRPRDNGTGWMSTEELKANQNYQTAYTLYDGFMRERQTQPSAWLKAGTPAGRVVTDTIHDSRGVVVKQNARSFAEGAASGTLLTRPAGDAAIPSRTRLTYDGAARQG